MAGPRKHRIHWTCEETTSLWTPCALAEALPTAVLARIAREINEDAVWSRIEKALVERVKALTAG